jgi:hypothetical protein
MKETFDFYVIEHGFKTIHFGCVEEWMNDYYWNIYLREAKRLIQTTTAEVLSQTNLSPWGAHIVSKKNFIYEDGIEKVEIFNNNEVELTAYFRAKYKAYCLYCEKLGITPAPMIPAGVKVVNS